MTWEGELAPHGKHHTNTGYSGKYEGASDDGIYPLEELTDMLLGGKYKVTRELP